MADHKIAMLGALSVVALLAATGPQALAQTVKGKAVVEAGPAVAMAMHGKVAGANSCSTASGAWSWSVADPGDAPFDLFRPANPDLGPLCDSAQAAAAKINADPTQLAAVSTAIDAGDTATLQKILVRNGLTSTLPPGAAFHAINTKGTGATSKGRLANPALTTIDITVAHTSTGLSLVVTGNKTGHITLNR